jgi:hypothetical protein
LAQILHQEFIAKTEGYAGAVLDEPIARLPRSIEEFRQLYVVRDFIADGLRMPKITPTESLQDVRMATACSILMVRLLFFSF